MNLWIDLPIALGVRLVEDWLEFKNLVRLDDACRNHASRSGLQRCFEHATVKDVVDLSMYNSEVLCKWLIARRLCLTKVKVDVGCACAREESCVGAFFAECGQHVRALWLCDSGGTGLRYACVAAKACTSLTHLFLGRGVSDLVATALLSCCKQLHSLELAKGNDVTNRTMDVIGCFCTKMKRLTLFGYETTISDVGLRAVARGCPALEHVDLVFKRQVTAAGLAEAVPHWPALRYLTVMLEEAPLGGSTLRVIASSCSNLMVLNAFQGAALTDADLLELLAKCKRLESLYLHNCIQLTCRAMCKVANLQRLVLSGNSNIDNSTVQTLINNSRRLKELWLKKCLRLDSDIVMHLLENGNNLTSLVLNNTDDRLRSKATGVTAVLEEVVRKAFPRIKTFVADLRAPTH